jgi:hypothetical protein
MMEEDGFEFIDAPKVEMPIRNAKDSCRDPFSQKSHASWEIERASERAFEPLIAVMQATAASRPAKEPIFHTSTIAWTSYIGAPMVDIRGMIFKTFMSGLPKQQRDIMNCNTCRRFMQQYGDLVVVDDEGDAIPIMWPQDLSIVPQYYRQSVEKVLLLFQGAMVGHEFVKTGTIGTPQTGEWNHMSITFGPLATRPTESQDTQTSYSMLERILRDNSSDTIARVFHLITDNQLPYSTSHKAPITYLKDVSDKLPSGLVKDIAKRRNLITKYARTAFPGCLSSLRGGMIGYLFECVRAGQTFETLRKNWEIKSDPLSYLRPTAAPTVGHIETAEKIFAKLGYGTRDLGRVYLTMDQVPESAFLWTSKLNSAHRQEKSSNLNASKLFTHLLPKQDKAKTVAYADAPIQDTSFRQFVLKVLPNAAKVDLMPQNPLAPYFFTTGKPDTKPIMEFHEEGSHTASWYTWGHASDPRYASLASEWTPVTSIITFPHMWDGFSNARSALDDEFELEIFKHKRHGIRFLFCLEGAEETRRRELCLFPTLMRGEFHSVRKTVEAFSNKGTLEKPASSAPHVGGVAVQKDKTNPLVVGVQTKEGQVSRYKIVLFE